MWNENLLLHHSYTLFTHYYTVLVCRSLCIVISDHLFKLFMQWYQTCACTYDQYHCLSQCFIACGQLLYRIVGNFWRVFVLGYFKEVFVCKNYFLESCFLQKCILTSTHDVIKWCCFMDIYVSVSMALYQYFKLVEPCFKA